MRKTMSLLFIASLLFSQTAAVSIASAYNEDGDKTKTVEVSIDAKYLNQKVDSFKSKGATYTEYVAGTADVCEEDYRDVKTEVNGFQLNPGVKLWDTVGVYGILGMLNIDQEFKTYDDGIFDGTIAMDGDNSPAFGFGLNVKPFDRDGWAFVIGGEYITQKADGTVYYTDTTGRKQNLVEWGKEWGASDLTNDYSTKFKEMSINAILSKSFDIDNKILTALKPYVGIEWFSQSIKVDGSATVQGVPTLDGYADTWKFEKKGVAGIAGANATLWKHLELGPYAKFGAKQEFGGMAKLTWKF
jgi:hypothetical protein